MPVKGNARSICIDKEILYVGSYTGPVSIYSLEAILSPKRLSTVNDGGEASGLIAKNDTLIVSDLQRGVLAYDISDPQNPVLLAQQECHAHSVAYDGEYIYVVADDGLRIFQINDH